MLPQKPLLLLAAAALLLVASTGSADHSTAEAARPPADPPWPPPLHRRSLLAQPAGPGPAVSKPTGTYFNMGTINVRDIWCGRVCRRVPVMPQLALAAAPPPRQLRVCHAAAPTSPSALL